MRLAICNEVLAEMPFDAQCAYAAALGYDGLEVAPYTLCDDPRTLAPDRLRALREAAGAAGVSISGLHWLLVKPEGLSITSTDGGVRAQTLEVMRAVVGICAELGGTYLVHGSPAQRRLPDDAAESGAAGDRAIEAFALVAEIADAAGVVYCIEPLAPPQANFITSVAEAAAIVERVGSPGLRTMIDCRAARVAESQTVEDLIARWVPSGHVRHIQVNDSNRRGPGEGDDRFAPVLRALAASGYDGWIAAEPLRYEPDGPATAARSAGYVQGLLEGLDSTSGISRFRY